MSNLTVQRLVGQDVEPFLTAVAALRIEIFRAWPYLYEGTVEYEQEYLRHYMASPRSVFVLALDGDRVVGVSTGLPMTDADEAFRQPFLDGGFDLSRIFYFGESVLRAGYRGQGMGVRFFLEREAHAHSFGDYHIATFCAVERNPDDPRRPANYVPLDEFWRKRGYRKQPHLTTQYEWPEAGSEGQSTFKTMVFWTRKLVD